MSLRLETIAILILGAGVFLYLARRLACIRGLHTPPPGSDASWLSFSCIRCGCSVAARAFAPRGYLSRLVWRDGRWDTVELRPVGLDYRHPTIAELTRASKGRR